MNKSKQCIKRNSWLIIFLFQAYNIFAATGIIKGIVVDEHNQPIEFAQASLLHSKSLKIVKGSVCNDKGEFLISNVKSGEYILSVAMIGYTKNEKEKVVINPENNPVVERKITLSSIEHHLKDVQITAKKKFIEQKVDKMVINPEASITTSSENVYEILHKLPGVTIDNNDNISLKGKEGVKILIDDKPTYMSSDQLASMLKGMQGKNVERIEIIENPSARYDAEGNAGIINIKTKHNKAPGFNGSLNSGITLTNKLTGNGGFDLNLNYRRLNIYGNYSLYSWAGENTLNATRWFTSQEFLGASQIVNNNGKYNGHSHNYKIGGDYYFSKKHVISLMFRGENGNNNNKENSATSFLNKEEVTDSALVTTSNSDNRWHSQMFNTSYKWDIDSIGQALTIDVDYAHFYYRNPNSQNGTYQNGNGENLHRGVEVATLQGNSINIFTAKADYVLPVNKKISLETGIKSSFVDTDSKINMSGTINQYDHFKYNESIQAAYINGNLQLGKTTIQIGLRAEHTHSKGVSIAIDTTITKNYLKLFPSLFVQQSLSNDHTINFNYSYRIGRPGYHSLNPFRWMVDPYTYNVGNPNLQPQFTHSIGLSHSFKNVLITSFGYSYTSDLFTEIIQQNDATKTIFQTMENLNSSQDMNLSETFQLQPLKWWRMNGTITGIYKKIKLQQSTNEKPLNQYSLNANITQSFSLPLKTEFEISAYYSSKQLISNIIIEPRHSIDLGIQHKMLDDKAILKVSLSDIFNTGCSGAYAKYDNVNLRVENKWNSRRLNISFNYRFGKDKFKTRSNRLTSSSEEQSRSAK